MADSTLDMTGEEEPMTGLGHGTRALGPSDSSDSGSDVTGGAGMDEGLSDAQTRQMPATTRGHAGRDLGDVDLDSDSDRSGTGERSSAGLDSDVANDQRMTIKPGVESGADEFDDPDAEAMANAGEAVDFDPDEETKVASRPKTGGDDDGSDDASVSDGAT